VEAGFFALICSNLFQSDQIRKWIKGLDGVRYVKVDFMRENLLVDRRLDGEIGKRCLDLRKLCGVLSICNETVSLGILFS
jgi:hypothetical protein